MNPEAVVAIITLVLIVGCLADLFIVIPAQEKRRNKEIQDWHGKRIEDARGDFPKMMAFYMALHEEQFENLSTPPYWVEYINASKHYEEITQKGNK